MWKLNDSVNKAELLGLAEGNTAGVPHYLLLPHEI